MILGRFEPFSKRPVVDCFVSIPSLNVHDTVTFLMDTGADCTVLMPGDGFRLGIDYRSLDYRHTAFGIGGESKEHPCAAVIMVSDDATIYAHKRGIGIAEKRADTMGVPSILGMDVMREWEILLSCPEEKIQIIVKNCDSVRPIGKERKI
jgi:hypothetical protein